MFDLIRLSALVHRLRLFSGGPEALRAVQEKKLRDLLETAQSKSPFYAKKFAGLDLKRCRLTDLPTTTKAEMMASLDETFTDRRVNRQDLEAFIAEPQNLGKLFLDRYVVGHTSGSQGQPLLIVQPLEGMRLAFAVQVARGTAAKRKILPFISRLWNPARYALFTQRPGFYPSGAAFSYLPNAASPMLKVLRVSVFDPIEETVAKLNAFKPHYLGGFTSSLEILAHEEEAGHLKLRESGALQQLNNFSEPLPGLSAARLEETFGVHVYNQYAMGECLALSSGCSQTTASHLNADLAILEVVDADNRPVPNGQPGKKVLVTNLYNPVQPFIRYEVDDVVTMSDGVCFCDSIMPRIDVVEGRSKDKLWIEEGGKWRELPYYVFLASLHHDLDIAEHQVVQTGKNGFSIRVAPQPGKTLDTARIHKLIMQTLVDEGLADALELKVEVVDSIPRGPSGKAIRVMNLAGPPPAELVPA
jgi:phenylacetate-coenzyme A ligase PaaK-like adenylate-forming protein